MRLVGIIDTSVAPLLRLVLLRLVFLSHIVAHSGTTVTEPTVATLPPPKMSPITRPRTHPGRQSLTLARVPPRTLQAAITSSRDFWIAKALGAWASRERRALFYGAERALRLAFPLGAEAGTFAAALVAAARVRRRLAGKVGGGGSSREHAHKLPAVCVSNDGL